MIVLSGLCLAAAAVSALFVRAGRTAPTRFAAPAPIHACALPDPGAGAPTPTMIRALPTPEAS